MPDQEQELRKRCIEFLLSLKDVQDAGHIRRNSWLDRANLVHIKIAIAPELPTEQWVQQACTLSTLLELIELLTEIQSNLSGNEIKDCDDLIWILQEYGRNPSPIQQNQDRIEQLYMELRVLKEASEHIRDQNQMEDAGVDCGRLWSGASEIGSRKSGTP